MAEEIRGLNVKFDADFSEFKKNMKNAEKDINSTQKQLKSLKDSLNLKWDPKKFTQAQAQAQRALEATEEKANILRQRLNAMDAAGVTEKTRDEYNYLSEQLSKTELSAQKLESELKDLDEIKLKHLTSGIDAAAEKLDKAAKKTKGLSLAAGGLVTTLGAVGLKTVAEADEIATLATQYELSTTALQRFNYVALQTDTEAESLYKAFTKVRAGVADLSSGVSSVSTKALEELNLDFRKFDGTEEQFYAIIDSLANMEDQTKMLSLANDIFGERFATNLLPLIYAGTDAINDYREEFESMGALTEEEVEELAEFDNVLNDLKTQYANMALQLGSGLLPVMRDFSEILVDDILPVLKEVVDWFKGLDENQQKAIISLLLLTATLSPALKLLSNVGGAISGIITWLGKLDKATIASYSKWLLLVGAIASIFGLVKNWSQLSTIEKVLYSLATAAMVAAAAAAAFHASWSVGLSVGAITAGLAAAVASVKSAAKDIGVNIGTDIDSITNPVSIPEYEVPKIEDVYGNSVTNNDNSYIDNSNIVINIEKNEYMTEDDIIRAVNRGLKEAKQTRK